jgi:hypothetical protein
MARFVAICEKPGVTDSQFRQCFDRVKKWRPDRRTYVVKAYCNLSEGKLIAECEASEKAAFEEWLKGTGWKVNSLYQVNLIHEAGSIWPV